MSAPPDPLRAFLSTWRLHPRRNPQFRTEVWARIGSGRGATPWSLYLRSHSAAVAGALALAIVVGAIGGWSQARARVESDSRQIASAYVYSLDARNMRMPET